MGSNQRYKNRIGFLLGILFILIIVLMMSGCAGGQFDKKELAFQVINGIDTAQTINHGGDPCFVESDPITRSMLGEQPKPVPTLLWGAALGGIHYFVTWELERENAPQWLINGWQMVTFTPKAVAVYNNHREGIRAFGSNESC